MIIYGPENPPRKGNAKQIWDTFVSAGYDVHDLHYNPGPRSIHGNGTWACAISDVGKPRDRRILVDGTIQGEYWCGIYGRRIVYIQKMTAPFGILPIGYTSMVCPYKYRKGCKHLWMHDCLPPVEECHPENGCILPEEILKKRCERWEKYHGDKTNND